MTPEEAVAAMPHIRAAMAAGLLAFPVKIEAGTKKPTEKGWQSKVWDLGMLEQALSHTPKCIGYGLTLPKTDPRRLVDLDLDDGREGLKPGQTPWQERLAAVETEHGALPATKTTETPSGGQHRWFLWPDEVPLPGGSWHGFTVRKLHGATNFVVGPGSVRDGKPYVNPAPGTPIATLPVELARSGIKGKVQGDSLIEIKAPYQLPETVDHGDCHLEVCKYTLSLWQRRHSLGEMWTLVLHELGPKLATAHTEEHLRQHFDSATADLATKYPRDEAGYVGGFGVAAPVATHGATGIDAVEATIEAERPWPRPRSEVDPSGALVDAWDIDNVLRRGRLLIVAGPEGLGKSRVRTEACIRKATGHGALFNHYRIPEPGRVLSFDVENGEEEETRREEETLARLGLSRADLVDYWGVSLEGLSLTDPQDQAYIRTSIERVSPAVVMFDTGSSMIGDEWGAELKAAIRFLRGLARQYGCAIVVFVHLVKPAKVAASARVRGKSAPNTQHGTALFDVMGQWTRQADTVALMADAGAGRVLWTVRKRAPHSQLVLLAESGTFDVVQVVAGEDLGVSTMERIHGCIATGYAEAGDIATYLGLSERTVFRHIAKLRETGRLAADAPLRVSVAASVPVSSPVSSAPSVTGAKPSVAVSDMSVDRTDTVITPIGGDSVSVSVDDDEPEDVDAAIAAVFPWPSEATA